MVLELENDRLSSVYLQPLLWQTGEVVGIFWGVKCTLKNVYGESHHFSLTW